MMPALVLIPTDTSTQLMHDSKLSGFPVVGGQAAPPQALDAPSSHRDAMLSKGLLGPHFHHIQSHPQQPHYARSLSHPLAHFGAPRVPPLHPPFTVEDMLDIRRHGSFLSVLSAFKGGELRGNLGEYFRPHPGLGHNMSGHNLDTLDLYHSDRLHASGLGASLPAQISTLYNRMMNQERSQKYRTADLPRLSSFPPETQLSQTSSASLLHTQSNEFSTNSSGDRATDGLSLSMSPLRLSESSSLSPASSSSSSISPSSSHPYPHKTWTSSTENTSWSSVGIPDRKIPHLPLPIGCDQAISMRDREGHLNPFISTFLFHPPSWHMAPASNDAYDVTMSRTARMSQVLSDLDSNTHRIPLEGRLEPYTSDWHLYHHRHHSLSHPDSSIAAEALLRSSSPRDHDHRSSPRKELPTKVTKQSRVRERQEVASVLETNRETSGRLSAIKKTVTASTQTQFPSFPHENGVPIPPPPYFTTHDTIHRDGAPTSSMAPLQNTYLNHHHHLPPPPPPPPFSLPLPSPSSSSPSSLYSSTSLSSMSNVSPSSHNLSHVSMFSSPSNHQANGAPPPASSSLPNTVYPAPTPSLATPTTPTTSSLSNHKNALPVSCPATLPPFYVNGTPPPPPPQYTDSSRPSVDIQHTPLNLSISSSLHSSATPTLPGPIPGKIPKEMEKSSVHRNGSSHEIVAEDEAIEEHFRRSLGQKYPNTSPSKPQNGVDASSMTVSITSTSDKTTATALESEGVHITGSVDDHFARALGDQMWTAIKAKSEPPAPEVFPGTVDAHFAKALGASMWKKLQADAEVIDPASHSPQHQQHDGHLHSPKRPQTSASPNCPQLAM